MRPSHSQPPAAERLAHWLLTALLAAAFLVALLHPWPESGWPMAALVLLATASTVAALARQLPLQNVLLGAALIALIGGGISALGARTGIPFGPFFYGKEAGPQLFHTLPWPIPLLWVIVVLNSRGMARLILRPWRKTRTYGFWLIGVTATLVIALTVTLDPFAAGIRHYWFWAKTAFPLAWQGAPPVNFLAWGIVTLLMLAFITPVFINKQLSKRSVPDFHPLGVWLGIVILAGATAARHALWPVAAVDGVIGIVAAIFAIRGGRW